MANRFKEIVDQIFEARFPTSKKTSGFDFKELEDKMRDRWGSSSNSRFYVDRIVDAVRARTYVSLNKTEDYSAFLIDETGKVYWAHNDRDEPKLEKELDTTDEVMRFLEGEWPW